MTIEEFKEMVRKHDLTYMYSDDSNYYRRGNESFNAIRKAAKQLPTDEVRAIWNAEVDRKIIKGHGDHLYWKE
jgi:hypothetical protein